MKEDDEKRTEQQMKDPTRVTSKNKTRQITRQEMWGEGEVTWPVKKLLVPLYTGCGSGSAPQGAKQQLHVQACAGTASCMIPVVKRHLFCRSRPH